MPHGRRSFRSFGPRSARLTEWGGLADQGFVAVASTGATLVSSVSFEDPGTLIRSRGALSLHPTSFAADGNVVGAFGAGIVSAEALAVGITALPHPYRDSDWGGWMIWESFAFRLEFASAVGFEMPTIRIVIDSKAMRKVAPNEALVFVAESQEGAFQVNEAIRLLLKLA